MFNRDDILHQARRKYPAYLRSIVTGELFFPLPITLGKTRRAESYAERKAELDGIREASGKLGFAVQWRMVSDPRFGPHERPESAGFSFEESYLRAIGKTSEATAFRQDASLIMERFPALKQWLADNVRQVAEKHGNWPRILRVIEWFQGNPRCGLYLRQLPIPGVDTKFMEKHVRLLDELLILLFPGQVHLEAMDFRSRHGLREEESTLRIRFLCAALREACGHPSHASDLSLPLSQAARLPLRQATVFITENLRNFLAMPDHPRSLVILGGGDASSRLKSLAWLSDCEIHYWGDLDQHGFAMLARLRVSYPGTKNFLMNAEILHRCQEFAVDDSTAPITVLGENLNDAERSVHHTLQSKRQRLEQERIPMSEVKTMLTNL
jgi:hypothetical protein